MSYDTLGFELRGGVAWLTLDRPGARNALNARMRSDLLHALRRAGAEARVVVLTGAGEDFCAGQDLGLRRTAADLDHERALIEEYAPLVTTLAECPVPTIAAVNGTAAGAGASLALAADVVIAADDALLSFAQARLGLSVDAGASYWLPQAAGLPRAMGAALFAEPVRGAQAAEWGLIWEAVPRARFATHVAQRAAALAAGPTRAYAAIKHSLRAGHARALEAQLALEASEQGAALRSRDHAEALVALHEGRPPRFEGR
ncbi:2-(1,2-epoxy-1,2-dihydrophenyl)acetyl-CoA isomerase [Paroceanicella profunda]|uniref:2-(1,2-epoxy-1,2-dihydrophenyl)acetyl-CoA isomerase n=1 Tax=Paroceanicella profunda TaxID=2579971 RepID=A0A5B8FV27_9RHOB|nr:enoyl-CoA hydratase-related protein [Paroceanicella profunda]QDL92245.1 2-(1,2-epoxy-1,2-dihydrophenyl)acetyl-CoA isomerase [Paroceanicella profunda]